MDDIQKDIIKEENCSSNFNHNISIDIKIEDNDNLTNCPESKNSHKENNINLNDSEYKGIKIPNNTKNNKSQQSNSGKEYPAQHQNSTSNIKEENIKEESLADEPLGIYFIKKECDDDVSHSEDILTPADVCDVQMTDDSAKRSDDMITSTDLPMHFLSSHHNVFDEDNPPGISSICKDSTNKEPQNLQSTEDDFNIPNQSNQKKTYIKNLKCHVCGFTTAHSGNLKMHMKLHTGEKNYHCELCEYKTYKRGHLKSHMMSHSGEKNFECNVCDFKTARSSNLKLHMKVHSGVKNFHCNLCDFKTARNDHLKLHIKMHTGEKNIHCNLCDYKTYKTGHLKSHLKRMHKIEKS